MAKNKSKQADTEKMSNLISQTEAAALRGVTRSAIHRLIKRGRLRTVEIGGHVFVYRDEIKAFEPEKGGRGVKAGGSK